MKKTIAALGLLSVLGVTPACANSESADQRTERFSVEKVLTVSAGDYAASSSTSLSKFEMKGVHVYGKYDCLNDFRSIVQRHYPKTEVVVDYDMAKADPYAFCYSTALIPRTYPNR